MGYFGGWSVSAGDINYLQLKSQSFENATEEENCFSRISGMTQRAHYLGWLEA